MPETDIYPEDKSWDEHCDERAADSCWCIHGTAAMQAERERVQS